MPPPRDRDRLGRPLPAGHPDAFPAPPERAAITATDALREADGYLRDGLPFHAHEVLETRWRCAPSGERPLWQALAQWAAALTHAARGNDVGARSVGARAAARLADWSGPYPTTAAAVAAHARVLAAWRRPSPLPDPPRLSPDA